MYPIDRRQTQASNEEARASFRQHWDPETLDWRAAGGRLPARPAGIPATHYVCVYVCMYVCIYIYIYI